MAFVEIKNVYGYIDNMHMVNLTIIGENCIQVHFGITAPIYTIITSSMAPGKNACSQ